MKNILKLGLIAVLFFFAASCDNTELDLLDNPNEVTPDNAELDLLFNKVVLDFKDFAYNVSFETQPYTRMLAMTTGNQYNNQDSPTSFDGEWRLAYSRMLPDMELILQLATDGGFTTHAGITKVMKAYVLFTLVDLFGDVPFTEALAGVENPSPVADDDEAVYNAALALLDEAINDLKAPVGAPANDLFYGGNAAAWTTLANTLKIRYYLNTRLVNGGSASGINGIISAGDFISEASEDFEFQYGGTRANPDSRHPLYADAYEAQGPGIYLSNYYMWTFLATGNSIRDNEDPRLRYYFYRQDCDETMEDQFTLACVAAPYPFHWPNGLPFCTASFDAFGDPDGLYGGYWGRDHGNNDGIPPDDFKRTAVGLYPVGGQFDADECTDILNTALAGAGAGGAGIQPILQSSYTHFMLAEASLTLGTDGDAAGYLETGIRQSIAKAQGFSSRATVDESLVADVEAYVTETMDKYAAADDNGKLNIVMQEYHKALWGQGLEAFNNYRRTGMPLEMQPTRDEDFGTYSRLMWYPSVYVNLNANASQRTTDQQVFWDNNPAGFIK
jgi:hypothetical protein